jgi:PAS domain S-box-containing protein
MASWERRVTDAQHAQLQALFDLAEVASFAQDPREIYRAAMRSLRRATEADRAAVLVFDRDGVIRFKAWNGLSDAYRAAVEGHSPWQRGAPDAQPILVPDVEQGTDLAQFRELFANEGVGALAFVPLLGKAGVIGKFMLYYNAPHEFRDEEIRVAQVIAAHVAFAAERRIAELELRDSEARFRAAFLQAAVGMAETSLAGQFRLVNERCCQMLGYTHEELGRMTYLKVAHPEDRDACARETARLLAGETPSCSMETRVLRKDGGTAWVLLYMSVVRDRNNQPQYLLCVMEDISVRVRAGQALRAKRRQLALARSAARLGIWECDLRRKRTVFSAELAELCGLAPGHPAMSREQWVELIHPSDRERVRGLIEESIGSARGWDTEFRVVWPDGSVHWLLGKGTVFLDDAGRAVRAGGVHVDITEHKQAEASLRESEERFRLMADTAPVMIWMAGVDKGATFFNTPWLTFTGRTLEQERGNGWVDGVHPDDLARCVAEYTAAFDARKSFHIEYRLRRADGQYRWVLCSGVPRFAPGGVFAGYVGSDTDITDVKRAQDESLRRQKLESLGVLTSGIAHDFNNLLGSILMDAELAEAEIAEGATPAGEIGKIKSVAIRASEIVRELMIYSGQDKAELTAVDLSRLVEEMLELLKVSISKHAVLKTELAPQLPAVLGNAAQLRQVAMNLIINASEAIGSRDGTIRVVTSLVEDGGSVRLEVADTGAGMTDEQKARVFDPFYTTKFAGRGLGLAVVDGIVRAHGGSIAIESAPGRGTRFGIRLPCAAAPAPEAVDREVVEEEPVEGGGSTVLLVEDEDVLRGSVSKALSMRDFQVMEAGDGTSAVDLIRNRENRIDIVLLDMTIPGLSSREVIAEARRERPEARLILMSAYSREMAANALGGLAIDGFLRKPFPAVQLLRLLKVKRLKDGRL